MQGSERVITYSWTWYWGWTSPWDEYEDDDEGHGTHRENVPGPNNNTNLPPLADGAKQALEAKNLTEGERRVLEYLKAQGHTDAYILDLIRRSTNGAHLLFVMDHEKKLDTDLLFLMSLLENYQVEPASLLDKLDIHRRILKTIPHPALHPLLGGPMPRMPGELRSIDDYLENMESLGDATDRLVDRPPNLGEARFVRRKPREIIMNIDGIPSRMSPEFRDRWHRADNPLWTDVLNNHFWDTHVTTEDVEREWRRIERAFRFQAVTLGLDPVEHNKEIYEFIHSNIAPSIQRQWDRDMRKVDIILLGFEGALTTARLGVRGLTRGGFRVHPNAGGHPLKQLSHVDDNVRNAKGASRKFPEIIHKSKAIPVTEKDDFVQYIAGAASQTEETRHAIEVVRTKALPVTRQRLKNTYGSTWKKKGKPIAVVIDDAMTMEEKAEILVHEAAHLLQPNRTGAAGTLLDEADAWGKTARFALENHPTKCTPGMNMCMQSDPIEFLIREYSIDRRLLSDEVIAEANAVYRALVPRP